ncbi:MAG: formylglycine-generating enzyme family protein [Pirellulales bacterium]
MPGFDKLAERWRLAADEGRVPSSGDFARDFAVDWQAALAGVRESPIRSDDERSRLEQLVERSLAAAPGLAADHSLIDVFFPSNSRGEPASPVEHLRQLFQLLAGQASAVLAADALARWRDSKVVPDSVTRWIQRCRDAYQLAWPSLGADPFDGATTASAGSLIRISPLASALHQALAGTPAAIWLAVERLLEYLVPERASVSNGVSVDQSSIHSVQARPLFVSAAGVGLVGDVEVVVEPKSRWGFYLDPLSVGLTVIDLDMQSSLELAWKLSRDKLRRAQASSTENRPWRGPDSVGSAAHAICIRPKLPSGVRVLSGESAGGLLACAVYAAASRESLDPEATASVMLRSVREDLRHQTDLVESDLVVAAVDQETIAAKLHAARGVGLRSVMLEESQAQRVRAPHDLEVLGVGGTDGFLRLYELLTHGARCEEVLRDYCRKVVAEWDRRRHDPQDSERLQHYVAPHFSQLIPGAEAVDSSEEEVLRRQGGEKAIERYRLVASRGDDERVELEKLLGLSDYLCVTQDAGGGKSVFTRRVMAYLAEQGISRSAGQSTVTRPQLAVRWESHWPLDIPGALAAAVADYCQRHHVGADKVAEWALKNDRVVLILDALDQLPIQGVTVEQARKLKIGIPATTEPLRHNDTFGVPVSEQLMHWQETLADYRAREMRVRVILTGRTYAKKIPGAERLIDAHWATIRIDGFDLRQQYEYLRDVVGGPNSPPANADDAWFKTQLQPVFPRYDDCRELAAVPVVLRMVRDLHRARELKPFHTRGELYLQATRWLIRKMESDPRKLEPGFVQRLRNSTTDRAGKAVVRFADLTEFLETILAAVAYEMMIDPGQRKTYTAEGIDQISLLRQRTEEACDLTLLDDHWNLVEKAAGLTDRCILEGSTESNLCFKHRGMMEFYCGLFLAKNRRPGWVATESWQPARPGSAPQTTVVCGDPRLRPCANQEDWAWAWRFAIEFPAGRSPRDPHRLAASLSELYRRPDSGRRPTELVYRAWHLLDHDGDPQLLRQLGHSAPDDTMLVGKALRDKAAELVLPGGQQILSYFRSELPQAALAGDKVAQSLLPESELVALGLLTQGDADRRGIGEQNYVRCPASGEAGEFLMGSPEGKGCWDERPAHLVRVRALFLMLATAVTRAQYAVFDPRYALSEYYLSKAPHLNCPAIDVSWYDAFCFAKWSGGRLPTEAEWEYACRAGTATEFHFGDALNGTQANCDGNCPHGTEDKGPNLVRTMPVKMECYPANAWGLYDMHGNVWEWCGDWYQRDWYSQRRKKNGDRKASPDDGGPTVGSGRVMRGGSWFHDASYCRSAFRSNAPPSYRSIDVGLRVVRLL